MAKKNPHHDLVEECMSAAHDAHFIAGCLMIEKVEREAITETAKQLERAARQLRKLCNE